MSQEVKSFARILGKVKVKGNAGFRHKFLENKNRLVVYELINDRVDAKLNEGYINELRTKMLGKAESIIGYEIFDAILDDFKRNLHEFEREFSETADLVRGYETSITQLVSDYTKRRDQGQLDFREYTTNYPALNKEVEDTDKNLLIDMFDKTKAYWHIVQLKDYEREKAQKMESARAKYEASAKNLKHLEDVEEILTDNHFSTFSQEFKHFKAEFAEFSRFRQNIQERGNLLEKEHSDIPELVEDNSSHLIPRFEEFYILYLKVIRIKCELEYHKEFISLNDRKSEISIKVAGEEAALPFLEQQQEYFERRVEAAHDEMIIYQVSDRANHLQNCIQTLNSNLIGLDRDIQSLEIVGGVWIKEGLFSLGSNGLPDHNLRLQKNEFSRPRPDVDNFPASEMTNLLNAREAFFRQQLEVVLKEKLLLDKFRKEYDENEAKLKENEIKRESKYNETNQALSGVKSGYEKLIGFNKNKNFSLKIDYLCCLLGLYFSHISINTYRKCHCGPSFLESVDIDPNNVFKILGGILKKRYKFKCWSNTIDNILTCDDILVTDYLDLVLDYRTGSCLKNSRGYKQSVSCGFREEDISDSLFNCLVGYARVLVLGKQNEFRINIQNTRQKILELEQKQIMILTESKHRRLAEKFHKKRINFQE